MSIYDVNLIRVFVSSFELSFISVHLQYGHNSGLRVITLAKFCPRVAFLNWCGISWLVIFFGLLFSLCLCQHLQDFCPYPAWRVHHVQSLPTFNCLICWFEDSLFSINLNKTHFYFQYHSGENG